jgi:hypothetical protein
MTVAEAVQQKGRDGVDRTKRWLESTTWIELPFDAYETTQMCTLARLDGAEKRYDLAGYLFTQPKTPLYVEAKDYDSAGGKQGGEYWAFLSNAYSITARDLSSVSGDGRREFAWVTRHPFQVTDWADLTTPKRIEMALDRDPAALGGKPRDADIVKLTSDRVWLLVVHKRQEDLVLTPAELAMIEAQLNRKGKK